MKDQSKYLKEDLKEVRKNLNPNASDKQARKENRDYRKALSKGAKRRERQEFDKRIRNGDYEDALDFWKK